MLKEWKYFLFLIWISYLLISGVLLFAKGFLLSRDAFSDHSNCIAKNDVPCNSKSPLSQNGTDHEDVQCSIEDKLSILRNDYDLSSQTCSTPQAKVILLIVDALRYDFTEFDQGLDEPLPYQNKLPVISETLKKYPTHSRLFKFVADPPTTTMQRLKALTTGSLPTFVDAGSNFATPEINEDNLIDQMVQSNRSVVFMGDDTWAGLYPNRFKRCWNFPSFNVWDLDTVDRGIEKNIYGEMEKTDWDLLIAHFLGVDHCGHRYGPNHPEMKRKLTEINGIIKKVIEKIDDNTMLFVIGDHGMTKTGDHGGESDLETNSALFIYSPSYQLNEFINPISVKQIDLIPTLSTILGIPIPFSNLGTLVLDALPLEKNFHNYLTAMWRNLRQTYNYIKKYSVEKSSQFSNEDLEYLDIKFENLKSRINKIQSEGQFKGFVKESREFLKFLAEMCEEVWIQFDSSAITWGLLIIFLTLFFTFLIIDGIPSKNLFRVLSGSFVPVSVSFVAATAGIVTILTYFSVFENLFTSLVLWTGTVSALFFSSVVLQNWAEIASNWYENVQKTSLDSFVRLCLILISLGLFSNSYIIEEATVLNYLILSILAFIIYKIDTKTPKSTIIKSKTVETKFYGGLKFKLILTLLFVGLFLKFSTRFWTCREEQKWCIDLNNFKKTSSSNETVFTIITLAILITVFKFWLRSCGNLTGFSPTLRYAPSVIVVCSGGYWALQKLSKDSKNHTKIDYLAWTVFSLSTISILTSLIKPLCISILNKNDRIYHQFEPNIIPRIFKKVKDSLNKNEDTPVVAGLATVYSATYVSISVFVALILSLLLGSNLAPSSVIMYFTTCLVLLILSTAQQNKNGDNLSLDVPNSSILVWSLLSTYFFYGTGHASQFPSIHWNAAFVGRTGSTWGGEIITPAVLVTLETFCSQIFISLLLPLLLIAPHTLTIMFQGFCGKMNSTQGEINLFEQENKTFVSLFVLCCKYFLCHGIRMFACSLAATIHCRHLMVWKIFAPKFMFETVAICITFISVLVSYLIFIRIHYKLEKLLNNLYKSNR